MEEIKVYRRKGAGAAAASMEAWQNKCDKECLDIVNKKEGTQCPMATMQINLPEEESESFEHSTFNAYKIFGAVFAVTAILFAVFAIREMIIPMIIAGIAAALTWIGFIFA